MVSTHLKNISQIWSFPQVGVKMKNIWNHHPDNLLYNATNQYVPWSQVALKGNGHPILNRESLDTTGTMTLPFKTES